MSSTGPLTWFADARFGMFIHFGLYSIPAGVWKGVRMGRNDYAEWIQMQGDWPNGIPAAEYQALAAQFNPAEFDADEWISELALAGMRYLVITSKHHDGFALWPSKVSKFNVTDATPFRRDIIGEIKAACDKRGIRLGLYYSHWLDWEHPFGGRPHEKEGFSPALSKQPSDEQFETYWQEKCLPQIAELCERYFPFLFWFDTWCDNSTPWITERRMDELIGLVRERNPGCLINSRIGVWGHSRGNAAADFLSMGDNEFPDSRISQPWETPGTMSETWGFHQLDFRWKPSGDLVRNLIRNAARGGNYQLNVGPLASGRFPAPAIRRLREIGGWLAANGEAVYGTSAGDWPAQPWGEITVRSLPDGAKRLYLHITRPVTDRMLRLSGTGGPAKRAFILETGQSLDTSFDAALGELHISLPPEPDLAGIPVLVLDLS